MVRDRTDVVRVTRATRAAPVEDRPPLTTLPISSTISEPLLGPVDRDGGSNQTRTKDTDRAVWSGCRVGDGQGRVRRAVSGKDLDASLPP